ncbi:poly(A) polymerase [Allopseudospirillum japonicum]|uniref:Poly(A) polymerase I n=1 Tax=Allopseudospirillum japonicum TaxID=64971 RepID=A0A1H6SGI2_9GAMM|nr:polynucleotide adenylyltransferase PcnB [Allopseudospirillum japonicum]SEI67068.1 poly(A) polymerase [Allopseudospirillum japonicum]
MTHPAEIQVISPKQHPIRLRHISEAALKVLHGLHQAGYQAYLVGGAVRDPLLDQQPKDFDVATDATPEQIKQVFRHARLIGRRFRIVHVRFGRETIEVTTFRGAPEADTHPHHQQLANGLLLRDNVYGCIQEDALRRDFTVNALYYNLADACIYDYAQGLQDIKARQLRMIGDPEQRYREDPVRMLRAVRFAAKLDFTLEAQTQAPISALAPLLLQVSPARMFDEVLKLFLSGYALLCLRLLREYGLFKMLFPATEQAFQHIPHTLALVEAALHNTDQRLAENKPVTPAFLYAALIWPALLHLLSKRRLSLATMKMETFHEAAQISLQAQAQHTLIPRRFSTPLQEIWTFQLRLPQRHGKRAWRLIEHPRFRAAYDFVLLREQAGEDLQGLGAWWTQFQQAPAETQVAMVKALGPANKKPRTKKRKKRARPAAKTTAPSA